MAADAWAGASGGSAKTPPEDLAKVVADLRAENESLKKALDVLQAHSAKNTLREKAIVEKMARGLSREQSIAVIQRQEEHDAKKAAAPKDKK